MRVMAAAACWVLILSATAQAQTLPGGRVAIEAVAAAASTSDAPDDPFIWLDLAATVRLGGDLDVIVRPYARRLPGGDWTALLYQAQIRYRPAESVRVDAGIITSPFGLGTLELRPDLNPVVTYPFYYFAPLPAFDQFRNQVQLVSGGYPLGAVVSWSEGNFDARGAITDGTPARARDVLKSDPSSTPQFVAGGGYTPVTGLRVGAGLATGKYRQSADADFFRPSASSGPVTDANATLLNVEAEYAVRYTRLSGEWVRDRFETNGDPAIARGFYVQGVQTLTPRIFAAGRLTRATTPVRSAGLLVRRARSAIEVTAGYRLTPQLTVKAGYQAARGFGVSDWNQAAVWSLVWADRWF